MRRGHTVREIGAGVGKVSRSLSLWLIRSTPLSFLMGVRKDRTQQTSQKRSRSSVIPRSDLRRNAAADVWQNGNALS